VPPGRNPTGLTLVGSTLLAIGAAALVAAVVLAWRDGDDSGGAPARGIAAALARSRPAGGAFPGLTEVDLRLGDRCLLFVIADSTTERAQGLRGRSDLGGYDAMLFVNEADSTASYTMAGVPVPLDIGWYDGRGRLVDTAEMDPCPEGGRRCPLYSADSAYRFAVETPSGELAGGTLGACPS
jgi:uncharacterized membrane protein (UPF0127 family)